jgi:hypothetical protein
LKKLESRLAEGFRFQAVQQVHAEPPTPPHRPAAELQRGVEAVNWMLTYPWVVERGQSVTEAMDYYFSDARPFYRQLAVEVYAAGEEGKYLGFAVFSLSQKGEKMFLKTLDFRFAQPSYERAVLALALRFGREYNAASIELPAEVAAQLPGRWGRLLLERRERIYQCMPKAPDSPLAQLWPEIALHLYDGDMAFS